jgi:hypothetical protein
MERKAIETGEKKRRIRNKMARMVSQKIWLPW